MLFGAHSKRMVFNKKIKIKKCLFLIFFFKKIICFAWLCWYSSQQRQAFLKREKTFLGVLNAQNQLLIVDIWRYRSVVDQIHLP
jgi:hypothetical protein